MKKLLLVSTVLLTGAFLVNAQDQKRVTLKPSLANKVAPVYKKHTDDCPVVNNNATSTEKESTIVPAVNNQMYTPLTVGVTYYDLQSNAAVPRRIINYGDGTLSFIWTYSNYSNQNTAHAGWPDRGTGYNYWNGTALKFPAGPTARLEGMRTGFPGIGILGNGSEVVMAHIGASPYGLQLGTNPSKGGTFGTFMASGATLAASSVPGFEGLAGAATTMTDWCRLATGGSDGNTIHSISNYNAAAPAVDIKGIKSPMVYSRSTDGGASWDLKSIMLPGYDSTRTITGGGDDYAVDANGTTAAIMLGGVGNDLTLWKSTDNGTTFLRTIIDSLPHPLVKNPSYTFTNDTLWSNDENMSVVVSSTGKVHVAYTKERVLEAGDSLTGIFTGDMSLNYWNDSTKQTVNVPVLLADVDAVANGGNGNGIYEVALNTTYLNTTTAPYGAEYGNSALLSKPSMAVDGKNIFIVFSLPEDADSTLTSVATDPQYETSFRDVWVIASQDGGATWGHAQNITCVAGGGQENAFASLAKLVDTDLHILYQNDLIPGTALVNGGTAYVNDNINYMKYVKVSKAQVLAGTASCNANGINEINTVFSIANAYPNPTTGATTIEVDLKQNSNLAIEVSNMIGQIVYTTSENNLSVGTHKFTVDASKLNTGVYFYTVKSKDFQITKKLIRE